MEADGNNDAEEEQRKYGPGGCAAAGGGCIKPEEMSLISITRERGGKRAIDASRGRKDSRAREEWSGK
jgi:hypothetical protein